jgi:hypothetical protein
LPLREVTPPLTEALAHAVIFDAEERPSPRLTKGEVHVRLVEEISFTTCHRLILIKSYELRKREFGIEL